MPSHLDPPPWARRLLGLAGAGAVAGAATAAYAVGVEVRSFSLRRVEIPLLPPGHRPIRVLHISDLHLTPYQGRKREWIRSLAALRPDLVIDTGDNLAHRDVVPVLLRELGDLLDRPGVFVLGSNDYYEPSGRNPVKYLLPDDGKRHVAKPQLPWGELKEGLSSRGWVDLTNTTARLRVLDTDLAFVGVDDPHLRLDDLDSVAGPAPDDADVRIGVTHAPYLRVLDAFARDGWEATFAGHTHGGQICLPLVGALTTNCDLDTARAKGLHRHPADSGADEPGSSWLHVSAGAGTSPYAVARLCCRPEASLVTLTPRTATRRGTRFGAVADLG